MSYYFSNTLEASFDATVEKTMALASLLYARRHIATPRQANEE